MSHVDRALKHLLLGVTLCIKDKMNSILHLILAAVSQPEDTYCNWNTEAGAQVTQFNVLELNIKILMHAEQGTNEHKMFPVAITCMHG